MNKHMKSEEEKYQIVDATKFSDATIYELVNSSLQTMWKPGDSIYDYYCGITNDLDKRMAAHRREDFLIEDDKVFAWNCSTAEVAAEVEKCMGKHVDIGDTNTLGNGGVETSTIVYLLKKGLPIGK